MKGNRFLPILVALSLLFPVFSGCQKTAPDTGEPKGRSSSPAQTSTITMGTFSKALGNMPYHVAKHLGWFQSELGLKGVTFQFKEYGERPLISDAFSKKELQILFSAEVPVIFNRAQGDDVRIVAVSATAEQDILVRKELPIDSVAGLRGKTIAVQAATSSHYCLLKILKRFGLSEDDVKIKLMDKNAGQAAFETNQVEAWAVWEPWVATEEISGIGKVVPGGGASITSVMTFAGNLIRNDADLAKQIYAIIQRGKKWIQDHPKEAQEIAVKELGLEPKAVALAWPRFTWSTQLDENVITDFQEKASFLAAADKTRQSKEVDVRKDLVDTRFQK